MTRRRRALNKMEGDPMYPDRNRTVIGLPYDRNVWNG